MKRFALPDTLPTPYMTIDAGADATLLVKVAPCQINDQPRTSVEIWRDGTILCRFFARAATIDACEPAPQPNNSFTL